MKNGREIIKRGPYVMLDLLCRMKKLQRSIERNVLCWYYSSQISNNVEVVGLFLVIVNYENRESNTGDS